MGTSLADCISDYLTGRTPWSVYLIAGYWDYHDKDCEALDLSGATGSASGRFPGGVGPDGRTGVVIPIRKPFWVERLDVYLNGSETEALCVLLNLAEVILHELVHLCELDTNPDCDVETTALCCWQEQRMVASMFAWAAVQRYPCLASDAACHADDPTLFANSGWLDLVHTWHIEASEGDC